MTLGKSSHRLRFSYCHLQNKMQPLLCYGCDMRCALFTLCRWEGVSGCHFWHVQSHTQVSVHTLPLHEGSEYCSGAPPECGLYIQAKHRASEGGHPMLWRGKEVSAMKTDPSSFLFTNVNMAF